MQNYCGDINVDSIKSKSINSGREHRIRPTVIPYIKDDTAYDAVQYSTMIEELAQFAICALCVEEGFSKGSEHISEC